MKEAKMLISENKHVLIDYKLTVDGEVVDESAPGDPLGFVSGLGEIVPGLEKAIQGKSAGDTLDIAFLAEEGYGEVQKELYQELPRQSFPDDMPLAVDMVFEAETPHGSTTFRIAEVKDDVVVADLNHPLAGKALSFSIKVVEVRDATPEELNPPHDEGHICHSCGKH